jgi:hypothetical protein
MGTLEMSGVSMPLKSPRAPSCLMEYWSASNGPLKRHAASFFLRTLFGLDQKSEIVTFERKDTRALTSEKVCLQAHLDRVKRVAHANTYPKFSNLVYIPQGKDFFLICFLLHYRPDI